MSMVISAPCLAAALMVAACDGFHAGYVSAGGAFRARAQALALAYAAQTDRLITASSRGDAAVARAGWSQWSGEDCDIAAGLLEGGEQYPELGARHGWQDHVWDDAMARRLNELLDRVEP